MMSNQNSKQVHEGAATTYPLIGREGLTAQQRAEFLNQARLDEQNYGPKDYQRPTDLENQFHNPNHPLNIKNDIAKHTMMIQVQSDNLARYAQYGISSGSLLDTHNMALQNAQALLDTAQRRLEHYYQANPHKRPDAQQVLSTEMSQENATNADKRGQGWHKVHVDASQPLQFTEAFKRTVELGRDPSARAKTAEFKPQVAAPDASALYTHHGETDTKIAWHQKTQNFSYQQPVSGESLRHAGKLALIAMGLTAAVDTANATTGTLPEKLDAATNVLKDMAIDAVPGVTYLEKMQAGKFQEAALDAASYLPFGDMVGIARTPEAQAVIDALPKSEKALSLMMNNKSEAPINRHLAEYQLMFMAAKNDGDIFKGLSFSNRLTDLAEQKAVLQTQWEHNSKVFSSAISEPKTDWAQLKKNNPDIAAYVDIHLAVLQSGQSEAFVKVMDANLTSSLAEGNLPVLPYTSIDNNHHAAEDMSLTN